LTAFLEEKALDNPLIDLTPPGYAHGMGRRARTKGDGVTRDPLSAAPHRPPTLAETLVRQLSFTPAPENVRRAAAFLAGNLDDSGYVRISLDEAAAILGLPAEDVERGLSLLQSLEPAGIAARDLTECLLLQIGRDASAPPQAETVVRHHLERMAKGRWETVSAQTGISVETLKRIMDYVRRLNPRPGLALSAGPNEARHIVPDAVAYRTGDSFAVRLNESHLPGIAINGHYEAERFRDDPEAYAYYRAKRGEAQALLLSLEKRKRTLLKVVTAICAAQQPFLHNGPSALRPLSLQAIADATGLHVSTVSRTMRHKHVQTPWGLFALHDLLAHRIGARSENGEDVSDKQVKWRIKEMIDAENKRQPYSDQQIADRLNAEGIAVSRRTVAKYRDQLRILPAAYRRQT
jgi:RNA polymerase sigma-54 factor